jgi:hypothetical protein
MNQKNSMIDDLVRTVLYEGYNLYPYRPSVKNRHRWTFGGLYPAAYCGVQDGSDANFMQAQCLLRGDAAARLAVRVLFLHLCWRRVARLRRPAVDVIEASESEIDYVEALEAGGTLYQTWQEAVPREVRLEEVAIAGLTQDTLCHVFRYGESRQVEPITEADGSVIGLVIREQQAIEGGAELSAEIVGDDLYRLTLKVANASPLDNAAAQDRDAALLRTLASANAVLQTEGGEFLSSIDPPDSCLEQATACRNVGIWPVLVGESGECSTILASPIILYDYPQIAPESPGDLFDNTEIDEILSLRIMTMTDEEKRGAAATDDRTRRLIQRTESLAREQLARLHGAVRQQRMMATDERGENGEGRGEEEQLYPPSPLSSHPSSPTVRISPVEFRPGDHVRLRPRSGGDIFDLALRDRVATIESIERDFEDQVYVAVTVDDDPGQDFGRARQPGHRFFFKPEEVELLELATERQP